MARILLIETATSELSVALAENGRVLVSHTCTEPRMQASLTAPYVQRVLQEAGFKAGDCDAVCVSKGPGSYTGLRVGVSTAKGIAFGAGIPLLAVGTLDTLVQGAREAGLVGPSCHYIVPMIDARRMEVYSAVFTPDGTRVRDIRAEVITPESFAAELASGDVLFVGDGAPKCADVLTSPSARFEGLAPSAAAMAVPAEKAWREKRFEDVAYFEPFYLKDFVATVPRKKLF